MYRIYKNYFISILLSGQSHTKLYITSNKTQLCSKMWTKKKASSWLMRKTQRKISSSFHHKAKTTKTRKWLLLSGWWRWMIYRFCDPNIHLIICVVVILHSTASALLLCYSPHTAFYSILAIIGLKVILRPSKGKNSRCTKNVKISFFNACLPNKIFLAHDKWIKNE